MAFTFRKYMKKPIPKGLTKDQIIEHYLSECNKQDDCLIWPYRVHKEDKIPLVYFYKKNYRLNRLVMLKYNGNPPDNNYHLVVKSSCGNTRCLQPKHLHWIERDKRKSGIINIRKPENHKSTIKLVKELYENTKITIKEIAGKTDISEIRVHNIIRYNKLKRFV